MQVGNRIYYNQNGDIIFTTGEREGNVIEHLNNEIIKYIDLPFGDTTLDNAEKWHVENDKIIIDRYREKQESNEEKLLREKQELENQLLLKEDKELGGIL